MKSNEMFRQIVHHGDNVTEATPKDFTSYPSEQLMRWLEGAPLPKNVGALIRETSRTHPERVVLHMIDDDETLTYEDLDTRVTKLASSLYALGVRRKTHVGVMIHTTAAYPVTWLALARLGAVTVPINVNYTSRELEYMLRDSDAEFLVIEGELLPLLEGLSVAPIARSHVVTVGEAIAAYPHRWQDLLEGGDANFQPEDEPELDDLMNIQYTSGTTGLPKGVMLTHRSLLTHARIGSAQTFDCCRNLLVAQPFYYVTGEWQFLLAIFQGGTAFFPRKQSTSRFMDWVRKYRIHYCNFPELVYQAAPTPQDSDNELKVLYCYSHQLENYRNYESRYGCLARQGYSMTEIGITLYVPFEADHMTGTGTVGIPAAFREVMIADEGGKPVPDGQLGEICVRGPGLLSGYYKNEAATRTSFHEGGWFRTGDVGRRSPEGWFWYLGRMRDMVKRSGENISATEVEAVLRGLDGIEEAAVLPVPDARRGEEVKAYLLLSPGMTKDIVSPDVILQHCAQNLARFKIPRYIEYVSEFPRTPSLKVKKATLIAEKSDLTIGCFDAQERIWR